MFSYLKGSVNATLQQRYYNCASCLGDPKGLNYLPLQFAS